MILSELKRSCLWCVASVLLALFSAIPAFSDVQSEFSHYFSSLRESFDRIAASPSLKDRNVKNAEQLFLGELRKNLVYNTFVRTNSKGQIISETVRGSETKRSLTNVSKEAWYKKVSTQRDFYSSIVNDEEKGRYYVIWAKPVESTKGTFLGAIMTKIDIWDCFYDFSNNVYYPFQIKMNGLSFFNHKWNKDLIGTEDTVLVPGVKKISVFYVPEVNNPVVDSSALNKQLATAEAIKPALDSAHVNKNVVDEKEAKRKFPFALIVLLIGVVAIAGLFTFGELRRRYIRGKIDRGEM